MNKHAAAERALWFQIMVFDFILVMDNLTICGIYDLEEGQKEDNDKCYNWLQWEVGKFTNNNLLLIASNFNVQVSDKPVGKFVWAYGEPVINDSGTILINFVVLKQLKTVIFHRMKTTHNFIWNARGSLSVIDYFLVILQMTC